MIRVWCVCGGGGLRAGGQDNSLGYKAALSPSRLDLRFTFEAGNSLPLKREMKHHKDAVHRPPPTPTIGLTFTLGRTFLTSGSGT